MTACVQRPSPCNAGCWKRSVKKDELVKTSTIGWRKSSTVANSQWRRPGNLSFGHLSCRGQACPAIYCTWKAPLSKIPDLAFRTKNTTVAPLWRRRSRLAANYLVLIKLFRIRHKFHCNSRNHVVLASVGNTHWSRRICSRLRDRSVDEFRLAI
jgi:hypothetical protein